MIFHLIFLCPFFARCRNMDFSFYWTEYVCAWLSNSIQTFALISKETNAKLFFCFSKIPFFSDLRRMCIFRSCQDNLRRNSWNLLISIAQKYWSTLKLPFFRFYYWIFIKNIFLQPKFVNLNRFRVKKKAQNLNRWDRKSSWFLKI